MCCGTGWRAGGIKGRLAEQMPFKLRWVEEKGIEYVEDVRGEGH